MLHRIRQAVNRLVARQRQAMRLESGQSMIILAFAFLALIAMLGLALDLGLVYIERVRVKRGASWAPGTGRPA